MQGSYSTCAWCIRASSYIFILIWVGLILANSFACGSVSKESTCNAGDPGLIISKNFSSPEDLPSRNFPSPGVFPTLGRKILANDSNLTEDDKKDGCLSLGIRKPLDYQI